MKPIEEDEEYQNLVKARDAEITALKLKWDEDIKRMDINEQSRNVIRKWDAINDVYIKYNDLIADLRLQRNRLHD